jgi:hypothetical protein
MISMLGAEFMDQSAARECFAKAQGAGQASA